LLAPMASDGLSHVPRAYSVYWGFGQPLSVLDDRELLAKMAHLKQLAARTPASSGATATGAGSSRGPQPPPHAPSRPAPASSTHGRAHRPRTAPPGGRAATPRKADPLVDPHQAAREQLREIRAQQKREVESTSARLEKRSKEADETVARQREALYAQAQERVARWDAKRLQARANVGKVDSERLNELRESLQQKTARVEAWRTEQEAEERVKRDGRFVHRAEATQRFATGLQEREVQLQDAEARVAARQSTMAELKRAEMERRAEEAERRQLKVLEARLNMERELQKHTAHTEEHIRKKALQVEEFRQNQHNAAMEKLQKRGVDVSGSMKPATPRGQQAAPPRRTVVKAHDGVSGLEQPMLRCSLCEQHFSSLTGATFLKAVATQRATFGDDELLKWCKKRGVLKMYESASLCVFCSQFFQARWHEKD